MKEQKLLQTLFIYDDITYNHARNTAIYMQEFVKALGAEPKDVSDYVKGALLHDVGKLFINDKIIKKPGKLTTEEFEIIKTHPIKGKELLNSIYNIRSKSDKIVEDMAYYHHERYDGTGYPQHLSGEEIPFSARLMTIVDVYDALTAKRQYKEAVSVKEAIQIMLDGRGKIFDPTLLDKFVEIIPKLQTYIRRTSVRESSQQDINALYDGNKYKIVLVRGDGTDIKYYSDISLARVYFDSIQAEVQGLSRTQSSIIDLKFEDISLRHTILPKIFKTDISDISLDTDCIKTSNTTVDDIANAKSGNVFKVIENGKVL